MLFGSDLDGIPHQKRRRLLGIIGGADGPTAIFTTIKLAPHLLRPDRYRRLFLHGFGTGYHPLVVKLLCSKKELQINMKEQEKKYPSNMEIKNLRVLKIIFPIVVTTVVALFVPSSVPLIGMLMFGNLVKRDRNQYVPSVRCRFQQHHERSHDLPRIIRRGDHDIRGVLEPDNDRHRNRRFLGIRLVYRRRYLLR